MGRRGRSEGTIYRRSDGRWAAALCFPDQRKFYYGSTREEVAEKLAVGRYQRAMGLPALNDRLTLRRYLVEWLERVKPSIRPATYTSYERVVRCHLIPGLGRVPLTRLEPQHVQRLLSDRLVHGASPRDVQLTRAVLRRALVHAQRWSLVARNVAAMVDPPRLQSEERPVFTTGEARRFFRAVEGDRLEALYKVALALGLRQGEALGLQWSDVDGEAGLLHVRHALQRIGGQPMLVPPKTASSRRLVPLPTSLVRALEEHRRRQVRERDAAAAGWDSSWNLVFAGRLGEPLAPKAVRLHFYQLLARAGLPRIRFHDLRHACATLLLAQGVAPRVVMQILGHSDITTTMNVYTHVLPELKLEAAARMDEFMTGVRPG